MVSWVQLVSLLKSFGTKGIDAILRYLGIALITYSILLVPFPILDLDVFRRYFQSWPVYPLDWLMSLLLGTALVTIRSRYAKELYCLVADLPSIWQVYEYESPFRTFNASDAESDSVEKLVECSDDLIRGLRQNSIHTKSELLSRISTLAQLNTLREALKSFRVYRRDLFRMIWVNFAKPEIQRLAYLRNRRRTFFAMLLLTLIFLDVAAHSWKKFASIETQLDQPVQLCRQTISDIRLTYPLTPKELTLLKKTVGSLRNAGAVPDQHSDRSANVLAWFLESMTATPSQSFLDSLILKLKDTKTQDDEFDSELILLKGRALGSYGAQHRHESRGANSMASEAAAMFDSALSRDNHDAIVRIGRLTSTLEMLSPNLSPRDRFRLFDSCIVELESLGTQVRSTSGLNPAMILGRIRNNIAWLALQIFADYWLKPDLDSALAETLRSSRYVGIVEEPLSFLDMLGDSLDIASTHYPHYGVQLSFVELGCTRVKYLMKTGSLKNEEASSILTHQIFLPLDSAMALGWDRSNFNNKSVRLQHHLDIVDSLLRDSTWYRAFPNLLPWIRRS